MSLRKLEKQLTLLGFSKEFKQVFAKQVNPCAPCNFASWEALAAFDAITAKQAKTITSHLLNQTTPNYQDFVQLYNFIDPKGKSQMAQVLQILDMASQSLNAVPNEAFKNFVSMKRA